MTYDDYLETQIKRYMDYEPPEETEELDPMYLAKERIELEMGERLSDADFR